MSVKVKGAFSEIAISNLDLEVTRSMNLAKMHRALSKADEIKKLFGKLKAAAPQAAVQMNKLARRRLNEYAIVDVNSTSKDHRSKS